MYDIVIQKANTRGGIVHGAERALKHWRVRKVEERELTLLGYEDEDEEDD